MSMGTSVPDLPSQVAVLARECPDRVYLQEVNRPARTYRQVDEGAGAWARALRRGGIGARDTVAVLAPTSAAAIEIWLGIARAGGIEVPVNTGLRGRLLHYVLADAGAKVIIAHHRWLDRLQDLPPELSAQIRLVVAIGDSDRPGDVVDAAVPGQRWQLSRDFLDAAAQDGNVGYKLRRADIASVIYTSGTTGRSKGVLVTWAQMSATAVGSMPISELGSADVFYSPLPLFHIGGKFAALRQASLGGSVVLRDGFSVTSFWSDIERYGATTTLLLGGAANFLYRQPPGPADDRTPLQELIMIPLIPELDDFRRRFGVRATTTFNMTELSAPLNSGWEPANTRTSGRPRPGYQCRIVDENDDEVARGVVGELLVRADDRLVLNAGYLNQPEATARAWRGGWFHTGDAFSRDAAGDFYFADRMKDAIRRRGENISSIELEADVLAHDAVLECAAVAVPSVWGEDEVKLVVVFKPGREIAAAELIDFLAPRVADFMLPRYIQIADELPKTATQKVQKNILRAAGVTDRTWDRSAVERPGADTGGPR